MKLTKRRRKSLFGLLICLSLLLVVSVTGNNKNNEFAVNSSVSNTYKVVSIEDGDTITVSMNGRSEKIRLIGLDTPETKDPRKEVQCFGKAASEFTRNLLKDSSVRLESDNQSTNRDRYNRLLRYVYKDQILINAEIIKSGYGFANTGFPFEREAEFKNYEEIAKTNNLGLWKSCEVYELDNGQKQTTNE